MFAKQKRLTDGVNGSSPKPSTVAFPCFNLRTNARILAQVKRCHRLRPANMLVWTGKLWIGLSVD